MNRDKKTKFQPSALERSKPKSFLLSFVAGLFSKGMRAANDLVVAVAKEMDSKPPTVKSWWRREHSINRQRNRHGRHGGKKHTSRAKAGKRSRSKTRMRSHR